MGGPVRDHAVRPDRYRRVKGLDHVTALEY
jgi:hypothetical protein